MVINEECVQSDPCELSLQATPLEDVWIQLSWSESGDDLDLHLLRNGGPFESETWIVIMETAFQIWVTWIGGNVVYSMIIPSWTWMTVDGVVPENINIPRADIR